MKRKLADSKIVDAAIAWWIDRRPDGWSEYKHLLYPSANCSSEIDITLARYVSDEMKANRKLGVQ